MTTDTCVAKIKLEAPSMSGHLQDEGGVDFRELGTTSPKLEDEFAPSLLDIEKSLTERSVLSLRFVVPA